MVVAYVQQNLIFPHFVMTCSYVNKGKAILAGTSEGDIFFITSKSFEDQYIFCDQEIEETRPHVTKICPTNGKTFYSSYANGLIKQWDMETGQCIYTLKEPSCVNTITTVIDYKLLLSGGYDSKMRLYDAQTGSLMMIFRDSYLSTVSQGHSAPIQSIRGNPKKKIEFLSTSYDRTFYFWDLRNVNAIGHFIGPNICSNEGIDINKTGELILTAAFQTCNSAQLRRYHDPSSSDDVITLLPHWKSQKMYTCKFISSHFIALGGSEPCRLYVMNFFENEIVLELNLPGEYINSLDSHLIYRYVDDSFLPVKIIVANNKQLTQVQFYHKPVEKLFS